MAADHNREVGFRLYLITDRKLVAPHGLVAACEAALAAVADRPGSIALQLREKDLDGRELFELAVALRALCSRYGAPFLVNDRIDVAIASNADGVHLPAASFSPADARALIGPSRMIGVSTHSPEEVARAAVAGADFAVYGPVFTPISKALNYGAARGVEGLSAACCDAKIPVYALGGITSERMPLLRGSGAAGVAAIGAVLGASSPGLAMRALLDAAERAFTKSD